MKRLLSLAVLVILRPHITAQTKYDHKQFVEDSIKIMKPKLVRPQFKFDNRLTFYEGQSLVINGFDAGVLLKDKMRLTVGYYRLQDELEAFRKTVDTIKFTRLIRLNYFSLNTEFIYKDTRFFAFGMPLELAFGMNKLLYQNLTVGTTVSTAKGFISMAFFGLSGTFKPIRWIGLKAIVGYRKVLFTEVKDFNFDGIFTSIGLNLDVREIIKDVQMFRLKKKYRRGNNISNAVDLITD